MKRKGIALWILPALLLVLVGNIFVANVYAGNGVEQKARKEWEVSGSQTNYISEEKAKQIMQQQVPGGELKEFKLDTDDDVPEYEGKFMKDNYKYEITLNALTGEVLKIEMAKMRK